MFYGSRGNRLRMSNIPDESDNSNAVWLVWARSKISNDLYKNGDCGLWSITMSGYKGYVMNLCFIY